MEEDNTSRYFLDLIVVESKGFLFQSTIDDTLYLEAKFQPNRAIIRGAIAVLFFSPTTGFLQSTQK